MLIKFQKDPTTFNQTKPNFTCWVNNFFREFFLISLKFNNSLIMIKIPLIHPQHNCLIFDSKLLVSFSFDNFLFSILP